MVDVLITEKNNFDIIGTKTWIGGTENEQFGLFWDKNHENGNIEMLKKYNMDVKYTETNSSIIGLSCTEKNPFIREFWFFIGVETNENSNNKIFEKYRINAYKWAIFKNNGNDFNALMECEMYAWKYWHLEKSKYIHDNGPEMEVYFNENKIEYWLPIKEIKNTQEWNDNINKIRSMFTG